MCRGSSHTLGMGWERDTTGWGGVGGQMQHKYSLENLFDILKKLLIDEMVSFIQNQHLSCQVYTCNSAHVYLSYT